MRGRKLTDQFYDPPASASRKAKYTAKLRSVRSRFGGVDDLYHSSSFKCALCFKCAHCRQFISTDPLLSGVNNRNHCPYCLWSRHLDLHRAGDRMAACKAPMQPVGLTTKRIRKKYGPETPGELMLVHMCVECGKISINRTAADDDAELLFDIFKGSLQIDLELRRRLIRSEIVILGKEDVELVRVRLVGRNVFVPPKKLFE